MKNRIMAMVLAWVLLTGMFSVSALAERSSDDIVILYENDTHCVVEGYTKLAA